MLRTCVLKIFCSFLLLIAAPVSLLNAQICNGSLGDPVVNMTFNAMAPSPYVPASGYQWQLPAACPNDGYYTVTNHTEDCFGHTWHNIYTDHTGNGNGNFMLVNASYAPGDFFVSTVSNLCPNTTYEFAAWVMNVMKNGGILPDLTFRIEAPGGFVLGQYSTGGIPVSQQPEWKQYGLFFTTPQAGGEIILRITNNAPGGIGNDLAIDDITFRPCGAKVQAEVQGFSDSIHVCEGNTTSYTFVGVADATYQSPVYQWQVSADNGMNWEDIAGANSITYNRLPTAIPGKYLYRMAVTDATVSGISSCRIASNLLMVFVHPKPVVDAGPDRVYIKDHPVKLTATVTGDQSTYTWVPPLYMDDAGILNPTVFPERNLTYTLSVTSVYGCSNIDSAHVKYVAGIFVPTAFTPNSDGKNDVWRIPALDPVMDAEVMVYNRWGRQVYYSSKAFVSWDGTYNGQMQPAGVYVYYVRFRAEGYKDMKGTVTLIR